MRVRMLVRISGTRDGLDWPIPGVELDLPDDEALGLIHNHLATPVDVPAERATVTPPAERAVIRKPTTRTRKD